MLQWQRRLRAGRGKLAALVATLALFVNAQNADANEPAAPAFSPDSDWPMYRRDPVLSASSPLRGGFSKAPHVAWSLDLGGPKVASERIVVQDVTGDGQNEFMILSEDSCQCRDSRGQLLWKLDDFINPSIVAVEDFAGDGSRGILLTTRAGTVDAYAGKMDTFMICGRTGKAAHLWRNQNDFGGQSRIGRLLPNCAGLQIAATASGETPPKPWAGQFRLVSFEHGYDEPHFRVRQTVEGVIYAPLVLFADVEGDRREEMVVIAHEQVWGYDCESGEQTFYAAYGPQIRTYWATVAAVKLESENERPSLVMINPLLPGLKAVCPSGKREALELWKVVIGGKEDQYQKAITIEPAGRSLVYDLENNGHYLLLASIGNEQGDGRSRLVVFDTRDGARLAELPDAEALAADDLDGDGTPELLLQRDSELHIARWQEGTLKTIWQAKNVVPLLRPQTKGGDLALTSAKSPNTKGNTTVWREQPGSTSFLLRFADAVYTCRLGPAGLEKGKPIATHEALNNLPDASNSSEQISWNGTTLLTLVDGRQVYRYDVPTPVTYLAPPPLVADLGGERRILVRDSAGRYLACSAAGKPEQALVKSEHKTSQSLVDEAAAGLLVCDMDGDGQNDIVATVSDAAGTPACVILDEKGKEKQRFGLLPGMTTLDHGPTGRLGPGQGRWIVLRMFGEGPNGRHYAGVAYDGRSGKQLWVRNHYGAENDAAIFAAHFPSAVIDYDGDGIDDWIICSENFYGIIDVKENKDLVGPVVLSDQIAGHWTAYSCPSVASLCNGDKPVAFHHGAYCLALITDLEGCALWHYGLSRDTTGWGQFLDMDGDGRREVLHAQPDGLLHCFGIEPLARCPTCPADAGPSGGGHAGTAGGKQSGSRWHLDTGRRVSRQIAADVDDDGRMELLFGGDNGKLQALGEREGKPQLLWSVDLGRQVGEPVMADIDGDAHPEILVTAEDGRLYCLEGG